MKSTALGDSAAAAIADPATTASEDSTAAAKDSASTTAAPWQWEQPLFHSRSLINPDSIYRPEWAVSRQGVAGNPKPYTLGGDSMVITVLLACFVLGATALAYSGNFISRQVKNFFRPAHEGLTEDSETGGELRVQMLLVLQTSLLLALVSCLFLGHGQGMDEAMDIHSALAVYTGVFIVYFLTKALLYWVTDWVFFDSKKNLQWLKAWLLLTAAEGVLLFPAGLLLTVMSLPLHIVAIYAMAVVCISKLLSFYKTYTIFFKPTGQGLQSLLYFCTLEILPLGFLWASLKVSDNYLMSFF